MNAKRRPTSTYEPLAAEYYDERHITSRNFDEATTFFFRAHPLNLPKGKVLELGAGRGSCLKYLNAAPQHVFQSDISLSMLKITPREPAHARIQADALALPIRSECIAVAAAFLCDPYNRPGFYREIWRILLPGALFISTIPHPIWGSSVRMLRNYSKDQAQFLTRDGLALRRDSFLYSDTETQELLQGAGLERLGHHDLTLPSYVRHVSKDISDPARASGKDVVDFPIVKLTLARKPS
jgi:SAM-dependent methyltransferase